MEVIEELRKRLKTDTPIIGTNKVLSGLRKNEIKDIYYASSVSKETLGDLQHYQQIADVTLHAVPLPAVEVGILCKKPFGITVLGFQ